MTYVIGKECIDAQDHSCVDVCPVDCIYEGERKNYINPAECIDCGACEIACPEVAIFPARKARTDELRQDSPGTVEHRWPRAERGSHLGISPPAPLASGGLRWTSCGLSADYTRTVAPHEHDQNTRPKGTTMSTKTSTTTRG